MNKDELMANSTGILQTQLNESKMKIEFLEKRLMDLNQQYTGWLIHFTNEYGEEAEPGVFILDITEENRPKFSADVAFQIEPNESEKKITFRILTSESERFANLKKAQQQDSQPKLVLEK